MTFSLTDVDAATAPARAFEGTDLSSLPRAELVELLTVASAGRNAWDLLVAGVAGEVAHRSRAEDGPGGLARQQGFASPQQYVASVLGASFGAGAQLVAAGSALAEDRPVADGLRAGLSVAKAELITKTLDALPGDTEKLEARLVRAGKTLDYGKLKMRCRTDGARHDAAHLEGREHRQAQARCLELKEDIQGVVHITGQLDPVRAAFVTTYLNAQVKAAFQAQHDDTSDTDTADIRTATQIRADALVALAVHGLDCDSPASGVKTTVIVRINEEDLKSQVGTATCDALGTPISLSALRQIAVDATILPMIVNGKSEVLDMGREHRLFSWAQRMALAERDGGCAKCHAPISHCITHHIKWWSRDAGPTDLRNGVLLCVRCHTQVHRDQWDIYVDDNNHVWFTPPRNIDPQQRRQLGGLAALTTP